jgi:CDP-glycerol glycerophosphotransferase (TagB/SpsB family)
MIVTASRFEDEFLLSDKYTYLQCNIARLGIPKYDGMYNSTKKQIIIMPTWRWTYSQTYGERNERFIESKLCRCMSALLTDEKFISAAKSYDYEILFKPHPRVMIQIDDFEWNSYVQIVPKNADNHKLYAEGALLVTDFSSSFFDFAYLGKPVIYYHFDEHHHETFWNYETMGFGEIVHEHDDLVDTIIRYMESNCIIPEIYRKRIEDFFEFRDNNNCKRVYEAVIALCEK